MDEGPLAVLTEDAFKGFEPTSAGPLTGVVVPLWRVVLWGSDWGGRFVRAALVDGVGITTLAVAVAVALLGLRGLWTAAIGVAAGWTLALLLLASWSARQRVLIGEFRLPEPLTAGDQRHTEVHLGDLLMGEISRLVDLFHVVGDRRAISSGLGPEHAFDATMSADGLLGALRGAVSPDTKVSVGPVTLPVAPILALLGAVLQAPRLTGGLHRDGTTLILTAEMSRRRGLTWIVTGNASTPASGEQGIDTASGEELASENGAIVMSMVRQLALRIFTDVALGRSVRWNATESFVAGLQAFRVCLRTPRDRGVNLKHAQDHFLRALAEDEDFPLAHYNLGVVYTELHGLAIAGGRHAEAAEHLRAAETAFGRAIEKDPTKWQTYFAYAQTQYRYGRYSRVVELAARTRMLSRRGANSAKVAELEARALMMMEGNERKAIRCARSASRRALRALVCARTVRRGSVDTELDRESSRRELAAGCLLTYGRIFSMQLTPADSRSSHRIVRVWQNRILRRSQAILGLARRLTSRGADMQLEFGLRALRQGRVDIAVKELKAASQSEPTRPVFLACRALAYARRQAGSRVPEDQKEIIDLCWETLETMAGAYNPARDRDACEIVALVFDELEARGRATELRELGEKIRGAPNRAESEGLISAYFLGALNEPESQADQAGRGHFVRAIADARRVLKQYETDADAAASSDREAPERGVLGEALKEADRATSLNPLSGLAWETLGDVYRALSDFERARDSWKSALAADPDNPNLYNKIGWSYWYPEFEKPGRPSRENLALAAEQFENALLLYDSDSLDDQALTHYRLGKLKALLGHFAEARAELRIVQDMVSPKEPPVVGWVQLGLTYLEHDQYPECEHFFALAADACDALANAGHPAKACVGPVRDEVTWPLGLVRAWAHLGLAFSLIKRDGDIDDASAHTVKAGIAVSEVDRSRHQRRALAACHDAEGEIALSNHDTTKGIEQLRESVSIYPFSTAYVHLASALQHSQKAASAADTDEVKRLLQHARTLRPADAPSRELDEAEAIFARPGSGDGRAS